MLRCRKDKQNGRDGACDGRTVAVKITSIETPAHRRVLQRHLGAHSHRHRHDRSRRDLLRRRRGRGPDPRHLCRPPARPQSPAHRGHPSRHAEPADGAVLHRRRISRGLSDRHRAVGPVRQGLRPAGAPDAGGLCRDKQRIYNTCAGTQYVRATNISPVATGTSVPPRVPTKTSTASCITPTRWPKTCWRAASPP